MSNKTYICLNDTETVDSQAYWCLCDLGCCWEYQWDKDEHPDEILEGALVDILKEREIDNHLNQPIRDDLVYVKDRYSPVQHKISKEVFIKNFKLIDG